jgi:hypothetical protein
MAIQFQAEIIEVKAKKLASGDKSYRVILETDQEEAIELQKFIAESVVTVEVK